MKEKEPKYLRKIHIPLATPAVNDDIAIRINNFHYLQKIEVMGSYYINLNSLIEYSTIN
jgi:Ca2+-dependent lipid-binding protein